MLGQHFACAEAAVGQQIAFHHHPLALAEEIGQHALIGDEQRFLQIRDPEMDRRAILDHAALLDKAAQAHGALGGLVEAGSVARSGDGATIHFKVTDLKNTVDITYRGVLPDLFREGQGVVVEGAYGSDGAFTASEVLAKHDEKYMPPEVAKALKESGRWQEGATAEPANVTAPAVGVNP